MGDPEPSFPFPFHSIAMSDIATNPVLFDQILRGEGEIKGFEFGYCLANDLESGQKRYLLLFQRKPYAAGILGPNGETGSTTLRDFFVNLARRPRMRLTFLLTDPVLIKSILVLQENSPATQGSAEFLRIENQIVALMEGRKDALVALIQNGRYSFAFVKGGKVVRAYFNDQVLDAARGMEWLDLIKRIGEHQSKGQEMTIRIYENMKTAPATDYIEDKKDFPDGVFKYYTRPLPELILRDRFRTLKRVDLTRFPFVIGRSAESDLVLAESGVSRRHAAIEENNGKFLVRDLDSTNGLFVNDHFTREFTLQDGDKITIGDFNLHVVLPRSPAEDVSLVPADNQDATMAMDQESKVQVTCPKCGASGSVPAKKLYLKNRVRIRCPGCRFLFDPQK